MTTMTASAISAPSDAWQAPPEFAAQCLDLYGLTCPPRWGTPRRPEYPSLGPKAWKVMERLGYPPMPWQKYVMDVALEIDPATGRFAHREVGLSVPRQQGKTQQILGVQVHRIAAWPRQRVVYAAQTRGMARTRWEDEFAETILASALAKKIRVRKSNGNEAIIWQQTRSLMGITANTEKAGHGPPLDLGVIDEAFAHEDDRLEQAFSPAMLTRLMAQLWWASAGGTEKSVWLNKKRATGRGHIERLWKTGARPAVAYFEWYAPEDMPRDDPATWRATLPALGFTVTEDIIRAELEKMAPAEFDRAYLNRTRKATPPDDPNVPKREWAARVDKTSKPVADAVALAIDVAPLRDVASIGVASLRADGRTHVELVARRPGVDWLVPALAKLVKLWDPVAVALDVKGPVGSLMEDLAAIGLHSPKDREHPQRGDLAIPRAGDVAAACGQFADAVRQGGLVHTDQTQLTGALNGARTRPLGDAWAWSRRNAQSDISPLCAVTFARWALLLRLSSLESYDVLDSVL